MECIILESSPTVREELGYIILSPGIRSIPVTSRKEAGEILNKESEFVRFLAIVSAF